MAHPPEFEIDRLVLVDDDDRVIGVAGKADCHLDGGRKHRALAAKPSYTPYPAADPIPALLGSGDVLPGLGGQNRGRNRLTLGHARVRSGFALLGTYDHEGRRFGLTTDLALLPLDRTRVVAASQLSGVRLSTEFNLPLAIVTSKYAKRYTVHPDNGGLMNDGDVPWRSAVALTGRTKKRGETWYLEARDGSYQVDGLLLHMPGYWEVYFDLTTGPVTERAQVAVER